MKTVIVSGFCMIAAVAGGCARQQPDGSAQPISQQSKGSESLPQKTVVLTFDDAVRSQLTTVAPLLKKYGFGATFFVTGFWSKDRENFLSWQEITELHEMGFEIGNHSWTHSDFGNPKNAAHLSGELALVEKQLADVGVPKPVSFAWPGNGFCPQARRVLEQAGYQFARRGMQPEVPYGQVRPGPLYDPRQHHPLLIPTSGDAYPKWTLEAFKAVVDRAGGGRIAVLQFHGVPDAAHPWVSTPPGRFAEYMAYLKHNNFNVIALRDLADYGDGRSVPSDAMDLVCFTNGLMELPVEVAATRANPDYWLENMIGHHGYTLDEAALVCDYPVSLIERRLERLDLSQTTASCRGGISGVKVLPYPGGRHPRIGNRGAAVDPLRGTKATIFAPWQDGGYVVVDLPEALFSNLGLTFLAHRDPNALSIWDRSYNTIENVDWTPLPTGALVYQRNLPNRIRFGGRIEPGKECARLQIWVENGTDQPLTGLRAQVCVMLKAATGFNAQTNDNKIFRNGIAAVRCNKGDRWILVAFDEQSHTWGHPQVPCMHSDPALPDAAPGEQVGVEGRLWFYEGTDIEGQMTRSRDSICP